MKKDKYQKKLFRYWVEEDYKGTFTREEEEESAEEEIFHRQGAVTRSLGASLAPVPALTTTEDDDEADDSDQGAKTPKTRKRRAKGQQSDSDEEIEDSDSSFDSVISSSKEHVFQSFSTEN